MPRNAQWAMDMKKQREEQIPQQMTVVRRISNQPNGGYGVSRGTSNFGGEGNGGMEISAPISSPRYTGAGVDGVVQPGKMVQTQVDEGEYIIPANAAQAFTNEEMNAFVTMAASGRLDKNKFRELVGQPPVQKMQTGGRVEDNQNNMPFPQLTPGNTRFVPPQAMDTPEKSRLKPPTETIQGIGNEDGTISRSLPSRTPMAPVKPTTTTMEPMAPIQVPQATQKEGAVERIEPTISPEPIAPPKTETVQASGQTQQPQIQQQTPMSQFAQESVRNALQYFNNQAAGMSESDRKIANFYLSNMDATNSESMRILESQISSDPYMTDAAKRTAIASAQREFNARKDVLAGELSMSSQQRADTAASQAASLGQDVQRYEDITKPSALQSMELERRAYEEITLPAAQQNLDIARRSFEEITLPTGRINVEQLKSNFNNQQWDDIQGMISKGMDITRVNDALTKMGLQPLSDAEYLGMLQASPLGEREWGRQLSVAGMLLQTPGATNKEAAATMYGNLFPGVDFDFDTIVSMENAEVFGTGLSNMASYVAADLTFDEALTAMQNDGTMNILGMNEDQAAQLYNSLRVNSIDEEWNAIAESNEYQALLNSNDPADQQLAADIKEFNRQRSFGLLGYEAMHEYNLYNEDGTLNTTVYAKTAEDANKLAASKGLTAEDTGNVQFRMASTITSTDDLVTPPEPGDMGANDGTVAGSQESYDNFLKTTYGMELEFSGKVTPAMWADSKATNADEYRKWLDSDGYLELVPDFPTNITASRGADAIDDIRKLYGDENLSGLTEEQINEISETNTGYNADSALDTDIKSVIDMGIKPLRKPEQSAVDYLGSVTIYNKKRSDTLGKIVGRWNKNLGKLVEINGKQYVVMGLRDDVAYVMDPLQPSSEIELSSLINEAAATPK